MSRTWYWSAAVAVLFPVLAGSAWAQQAAGPACGSQGRLTALESVGLTTDQRLICFIENAPQNERELGKITGLMGGEMLVGIDFRPSNGMLYGLGNQGGVYIINPATAVAMRQSMLTMMGQRVMLQGTSFGVDFNPVPDRLRVTSDMGQSLRVNVDTGETLVDGILSAPAAMAGAAPTATQGVTAVGYTNNDMDMGTATVLYDIDTTGDQLSIQAPPNAGTLNPVGALGMNAGTDVSLDIFSQLQGNTTQQVRALVTFLMGNQTRVFTLDLTSGRLTMVGSFDADDRVIGLAIPLKQGN